MNLKLKNIATNLSPLTKGLFLVVAILLGFVQHALPQAITVDEANTNQQVRDYVENVLLGSCVTVSNITYTGPASASGTFDGTGTILGLDGGIILTTGEGDIAEGPDDDNNAGNDQGNVGDADLTTLAGITTYDAVILEFDFVPQNAGLSFNYIFGSEEYPEWVNAGYNDVFGFFISGPGITGPYSSPGAFPGGSQNIALLPATTTPVAIDNVNNGQSGTEPATGPCTNCAFYVDNSSGPALQYDGYTTVLTAEATVTPCETYHIKLAVGDAGDHIYDSGVFLEEGSFSAGGGVTVDIQTSTIPPGIFEGCNDAWFIFKRVDLSDTSVPITADFTISGTATPTADYAAFPTSITIPAGEDSVFINLGVVLDFIPEGPETIIVTMDDPPCTCLAPASATVTILDNDIPLAVSTTGTTTICLGQSTGLTASPAGSQTPYTSGWDSGAPAGDNVTVSPTTTTTYTYTVTDNCGGQTVNSSETITVIRPDFTVDDDEQCFDGNNFSFTNTGATGGSVTHLWDFGDSNTSTAENPTHTYAADGTYTVTHSVIYAASNCTADASAIITVFEEPVISLTVDQDVICSGGTDGAISTSVLGGTANYNYLWTPGGATTSGISGLGVGGYSVTVTDANGCTDNGSETIVQNDPVPPTAVCQDITVQLDASGNATISATDIDNGSSDNCGIASMVVSVNAFDCNDIGGNAVTLTVTDVNANVSTCNATVTVEDNIDPNAVCQNTTVQLDASGNASIVAADVDGGSTDNCSVSVTATPLAFTCANVGANTVVLTATDGSGNTDNCNATVTVEDNIDPTAVCQNATIQLDGAGTALVVPGDIDNGSSDNCAIAGMFVNPAAFTCANIGANTVTLTVTDVNGNSSTCTATVTIEDNVDPNAVCQNITVQLNGSGNASIVAADVDGGSTDNCSVTVTATPLAFTCANIGANTVVLTATDGSGNTDNCNATVTVEDNVDPNAVCQNITVQLDASGNASIVAADVDGGSTDNCSVSISATPLAFTCANVGANTVALTATDGSGNTDNCNATVTVEDNINPTAVCQDITVQLDASGNATISATDVDNGSSDNCAVASLVVNPNAFNCANVGANSVTLTVTDVNGNSSTCNATVTVEDNINPTAVCQDITVQLDANGDLTILSSDIDGSSSDNCGVASLTIDGGNTSQSFACSDVGTATVTLTVTDVNGNVSTCDADVTIEDNIDATAVCQDITVQLDANGDLTVLAADIDGGSNDNCGIASITIDGGNASQDFGCSDVGTQTITLTVTDNNGNVSTCDADVIIEDNIDPTAVCQDITIQLDAAGNASISTVDIDNGSVDNCGIASITLDGGASTLNFDCNDVGTQTVTLTVTDVNGNVSTCTADVTIEDNVDPTAVCQDITVQLDANGDLTLLSADIDGGSSDNCGIASVTIDGGNTSQDFGCSDVGTQTITLTVTDVNGNVSTCDADVTIEDNIDPTAVCQDITIQLDASGNASISTVDIDNGSVDNCGIASITLDGGASTLNFDCSDVGTQTVTLTVTDVNGNVSTCTADVTIEDNVDPTAVCQDITVQLDANGDLTLLSADIDGGSSDNCGIASVTIDGGNTSQDFGCSDVGTQTITLTVIDVNGNVSTCDADVTIEDSVDPTAVCQDITVQLDANGDLTLLSADIDGGSSDNCGIASVTIDGGNTSQDFGCSDVGVNTITLTVTDVNGNVSTCDADVTIEDNIDPTAVCQDITIQLDASGNASISTVDIDNGSVDNCGIASITLDGGASTLNFDCNDVGTQTVTLTVTDVNGNISTCTADVTIEDNVDPTAVCQDITVQLDANGDLTLLSADIDGGSSDNCGIASVTIDGGNTSQDFGCSDVGVNTITLTVTDVNGNVSTCDADVTIEDNIDPTAVCQDITIQLDASGNASISTVDIDNGSVDNCGIAFITLDGGASTLNFDCSDVGTQTVTLTVTDVNGNVSTCTADVTIEDNVDPTALCQDITVQLDAAGNATITGVDIDNGSTDNCGIASLVAGPNSFDCDDIGANTVTLTVTDNNGNVTTCTADVTIEDNVNPDAVCQNITVQLDANGDVSIVAADVDGGSSDNCAIDFMTVDPNVFNCNNLGTNLVLLTVTDVNGNVSTCTATVTVEDNVPPTPICQDIIAELDPTGNVVVAPGDVDNGSFDNCAIVSITLDPNAFVCADIGLNAVTLTVTDVAGNVSTCSANVDVQDNVLPSALCQDITVELDASGNAIITPNMVNNGSSDACGTVTPTIVTPANFDCSNVGVNIVTLTVEDPNGNISTCESTVTIEDNINPDAVCQDITVQLDATGNASIVPADVDGGSSDNCAIDFMTVDPNSFTCAEEGANTVTLTVTDVNGNVSTCTAVVTVENTVIPTVSCQDITIYLDAAGNASITAADVDGGSNAACGIASLTVDPSTFDCSNVGPNTVTLTGTDNSGNVSTCTAVVTVVDDIPPTAVCQDITVQLDASGNATIVAADVDGGSSDNCAIASLSATPTTFGCDDVGANSVVLTVTDVNGNVSTCNATVTVEDDENPTIVCQDIFVQLDANGEVSITGIDIDNGSSDNCSSIGDGLTLSLSETDFDCTDLNTVTVTLTATDENGNASTCTATVTILDNDSPTALCQDITVYLDASGNASIVPADVDNGSFDNCSIVDLVVTPNTFTCAGVGPNPVSLTATDQSGNVATCSATVTVLDTISPTAVCQDITVQLDGSGNASIVATQINNGSFDVCGIASLVLDQTTFDCSEVGANTVTLTVTDLNGNVSTCSSSVELEDNVDPTAVCQDIAVQLDAAGNVSIVPADIDNGSSDNCAVASLSADVTAFDCSNVGDNVVTLTVTDVNGNTSTCVATVTVEDNVAPIALCQDVTVQLDATGNTSITTVDVDNGSNDNCAILSLDVTPNTFDCSNVGGNTVTLTVTDVNGNVSTCTATVTVEDNVNPNAVCQDITVQLDATGNASIVAADVDGGSSDNCAIASLAVDPSTFDCDDIGGNTVTLTVTDVNGNVSTCTATVTVEDDIDPTIVCQDITVQLDATGNVSIVGADIDGGTTDNCSQIGIDITLDASPADFDCNDVGTSSVTLTATDAYGNVSTCTADITVEDDVPPTAVCQDITVQLDATGNVSIVAADVDGGSSDNCAIDNLSVSQEDFVCAEVGGNTVTLTVTDVNGNVSTCTATVTVEDNVAPIALCQDITIQLDATGNATISATDVDNGSSDNCAIASMVVDPNAFTCADEGANTVTLTVTDVNGNVSTCTSTVTVENNVAPNVFCQDITVYLDGTGNVGIIPDDVNGGSNASCGLASLMVTPDAFNCANVGPNTVTLTAVDNSGNSSTCTAVVTVVDTINPTAVCQDITVQLDVNGDVVVNSIDIDGGSADNCGVATLTVDVGQTSTSFNCSNVGVNTVTLTVTDVNGNVSTCDAEITVEDNISPTAVCQDITVDLDANGELTINSVDIDGGSTDNCGIASITVDGGNTTLDFGCSQVGANTVTLTVTDVNGNVSTCDAEVTVEDNINPTAICQDITVELDANGELTITSADIDGGSTDNCGIASITVDGGNTTFDFDCSQVGANTVTLTVTDVNGNVSTCDATVTIEDNIDPTAVCQDIIVQLDANGDLTITSADIDGGSSDNCGIASLTVDQGQLDLDFGCVEVGVNTITLTVTDVNGNVSTCDAEVTVEDNVNPTAVCQDITVQLDANGEIVITSVDIDGGSTDNCTVVSLDVSPNSFDCTNYGANAVVLTVTDNNGNISTCIATVTVADTIAPTAVCTDITVQLEADGTATIAAGDVDNGSFDNCAIQSLEIDIDSFDCSMVGPNTVTLTVTDVNGNVSTCTSTATVEDNVDPLLSCQNITVQLDENGEVAITAIDVDNGSTDACGIDNMSVDVTDFDCTTVGVNQVTLTVTDVNGNFDICQAVVTVLDTVPPTAVCQDITIQLDATGTATIVAADVDGGSTDNCAIDAIAIDQNTFDCTEVGDNIVTLTVVDVNGNTSTCEATVTVEDNINPNANCDDITIYLDANGMAAIDASDINAGSDANCGVDTVFVNPNTFTCAEVGNNTVTLTVIDNNGNISTCTANVEVLDTISPTALCQDLTLQLSSNGQTGFNIPEIDNGSFDNCAIAGLAVDQTTFDCDEVGDNTVTLTVTDVNGNVSTCTSIITVQDTVAPTANCSALVVQLDAAGQAVITTDDIDLNSSDNCAIASLVLDQDSFDCSQVGTNTVTLTVTDVNGNVSTCSSTVIVEDNVPPTSLCQDITIYLDANGQVSIVPADVDAGSTDNCAIDTMYVTPNEFTCSGVGVNPVTLTVTDVNQNTSSCVADVTVLDTISPIAVCQDITIQLDASGNAAIDATEIDNGSNDACGIANFYVDVSTFSCATVTSNTVTLTVEDNNGNTSTCTAEVLIEDNVAPEAVCQDATLYLDDNGQVFIASVDIDGGSTDNCLVDTVFLAQNDFDCDDLGTNIIELTVVDINGNSDACSAEITVLDTVSPVIIACPTDIVVVPDSSNCSPQVFWTEPTTEDNCTTVLTSDFVPGDNFSVGTTTVTYTSTDQSGNTAVCMFDVTIEPSPVLVSITPQEGPCGYNLSCSGAADGQATANPAGGCLPYTFLWSDPLAQTTQTATGLSAGSYAVTVTDANGTTATETVVVTEPDVLATDSLTSPEYNGGANISCNGEFDGAVNINVIGGSECVTYDFAWTGPNGFTSTSQNLTNLEAGTYVVTVSDASGCSYMDSITLEEPAPLDADSLLSDYNGSNISCGGAADGSIDLTVTGGATPYTFSWSNGDTTEDIDSLSVGIYTYTITDANGCEISGSITLTEPDGLSSFITTSDYNGYQISCFGLTDGSIDLTVNEGTQPYSYLWNGGQVTEDLNNLPAGTYIVDVTDANGCTLQDSVTLNQPDDIVINPTDTNLISCNTADDGAFTVEAIGGVPAFTYSWSNGQTGPTIQDLGPGSYVVLATDINGCQDSIQLNLTEPFELEAFVIQTLDVVCNGESNGIVDVTVIGGTAPFTYQWSTGSTDQDLNGVPAGEHDLEVTDAHGCVDTITAVVSEPDMLIMTVDNVTNATCSGIADGAVTVAGSGGTAPYTYFWPELGVSGPTATDLAAGVYEVQVTDAVGCGWSLNVVVGQPTSIDATVSMATEVSCNGLDDAEALVVASGGTAPYTYLWSNADVDSLAEGLSAGTYTVTVADAAGCDTTLSVVVTEPTLIDVSIDTVYNITCNGYTNGQAEVDVAGGTIPYTVTWSNGDAGYVANNLGAGTHTAYVTDGNGCMDSLQVAISEPDTIQLLQAVINNTTCFDGNDGDATVLVEGGVAPYTYNWPFIGQSGNTATNLPAGAHVFVVSDANNCSFSDTVVITQPEEIIVTVTSDTAVCPDNGVSITASAVGGTGNYSYAWDNGLGLGATHFVSPSVATTYNVQVTDQSGCAANVASVTVNIAQLPVANFTSAADAPCVLPTTINFTNTSTGATGFEWLLGNGDISGDENPTASYNQSGDYTVTLIASSGAGCSDTTTQIVTIDDVPTADFTLDNAQGCAPLAVNFGNTSGVGLEYTWNFGDGTTSTAPNPTHYYEIAGDYEVTLIVSAPGGCTDTLALGAAVSVYPSPIADFTPQQVVFPEPGREYDFINNSSGADLYNWDFGNGEQTDEYQPNYEYPTYGGYFVTLTAINEFGCADTAVHYLNIELNTHLYVPNAMGIGEPGEAGVFLPKGTGIEDYHVWIFDNWGNQLWESTALINGSPAESWDGQYKGQYVPQGSYVWKINATFVDGEIWEGQENTGGNTSNTGSIMVLY